MNERLVLFAALLSFGCDSTGEATAKAKQAAKASKEMADKAAEGTRAALEGSKEAYGKGKRKEAYGKGKQAYADGKAKVAKAKALWNDVPETGELSETAKGWLAEQADGTDDTIAAVVESGTQVTPVALEIGKSVSKVVDSEHKLEPIYQELEEGKEAEVDAAISNMPRVEVIEGVKVGFKQLDEKSAAAMVKERGYLVTWRKGNHLIGFVYRSKRTIDVDALVAETPRLLGLIRGSLAD